MDGRTAPYSGCWKGEYLDDTRQADEYSITEYDLETFNYYIVQESLLGSLFYYTVSRNEIWEISKTFFKLSSRPLPRLSVVLLPSPSPCFILFTV